MSNAQAIGPTAPNLDWSSDQAQRRVRRRYAADRRLQAYGIIAIALAVGLLGVLIASLISTGFPAFIQTKVELPIYIDPAQVDPQDPGSGKYRALVREAVDKVVPGIPEEQKRSIGKILTSDAAYIVRDYVVDHPDVIGKTITLPIAVSDPFDQLHKGVIPKEMDALNWTQVGWFERLDNRGLVVEHDGRMSLKLDVYVNPEIVEAGPPPSGNFAVLAQSSLKAYLPRINDTSLVDMLAAEAPEVIGARIAAEPDIIGKTVQMYFPLSPHYAVLAKGETPKVLNPRFSQDQLAALDILDGKGLVRTPFNWELFFNADSRFPERAGLAGAITGSFYALLVCFLLSFPIGIAAAVYLEEFAPKNRFTDLIEVNINNLAAVPSVVFGLLGLAVFLGFFGLPRSAPLVGGMVLSLMTLPTIIITTRAALKAVPPSIREAALGVGASKHQVMIHHVLPLALPGILTGTIIGMAQALGETAPLLLIGMNAFIPSIENMGLLEPATSLPTQIFSWADSPERGFVSRTSAAILVLLGFLVIMNIVAITLRQMFQRKW
ncbi:phosphate ABC transporter permease PstA [Methyloceanibacter superfactus]|jgi:phosphate transport system permease protein|uniref:phosphate ABC transporter permease PstA n=1 Tax=Methyloceanibacter superfactus TaxID=1774969 RepID=UPI000849715B|nr:phosphate ABC transporter permease PstA [Methyloceanibacter superfactus]